MDFNREKRLEKRRNIISEETAEINAVEALIADAEKAGDDLSLRMYKEKLTELEKIKEKRETINIVPIAISVAAVALSGGYILSQRIDNNDEKWLKNVEISAENDGFNYVSLQDKDFRSDDEWTLTVEPLPDCTITTVRTNHELNGDNPDIKTYTFPVKDGEVTVQSAEEVIERYGQELCQITE